MSTGYIDLPAKASPRWKSPVANASLLPSLDNTDGDVRVTLNDQSIYVWKSGSSSWQQAATPAATSGITALTTDVMAVGPGAVVATIQPNVVINSKLADMATQTIKGRNTAGTGDPEDLTVSQVSTMLGIGSPKTEGSVIFAGTSGILSEDNADFFWDNSQKFLGIGTDTPAADLEIRGVTGPELLVRATGGFNTSAAITTLAGNGASASLFSFRDYSALKNGVNSTFKIGNIFSESLITTQLFNVGFNIDTPQAPIHMSHGLSGTANYGALSLGDAPFDGSTSGFFTGSTDGTEFAINSTSLLGDLVNFQVNGFPKLSVSAKGRMAVATLPDANVMLKVQSIAGGDPPFQAIDPIGQNVLRINTDTAIAIGQLSNFILIGSSIGSGDINGSGMQFYSAAESSTNTLQNFHFSPYNFFRANTSGTSNIMTVRGDFRPAAGSGSNNGLEVSYDINSSGAQTGTKTGIIVNATETALNGMAHNLLNLKVGGTSQCLVTSTGNIGIGTDTPRGPIDIVRDDPSGIVVHIENSSTANPSSAEIQIMSNFGATGALRLYTAQGQPNVSSTTGDLYFGNATGQGAVSIIGQNLRVGSGPGTAKLNVMDPVVASANYGTISVGGGAWDGSTSGFFAGSASGTLLAANEDTGFTGDLIDLQTGGASRFIISGAGAMLLPHTNTTGGTTGNQTINKISGTVNIAAAGTTVTVTNSLVTANSIVMAVIRTNDTTASIKNVVPASGSFAINIVAATAEVSIGFFVINQ